MVQLKQYYRTEETIGLGGYLFRRFSSTPMEEETDVRFIEYVIGTIEEIFPEDFGNATSIPDYCMYSPVTHTGEQLLKVSLPDTVTKIGEDSLSYSRISEIVFSSNITSIGVGACSLSAEGCIYDFSKAKTIPTRLADSDGNYTQFSTANVVIKVPSNLYNNWIARTDWKDISSKIVSA